MKNPQNQPTPAPWIANAARNPDGSQDIYYTGQPGPFKIATCNSTTANARLIAAAPDMLAALETLRALGKAGNISRHETDKPTWHLTDEIVRLCDAAISAARID